MTPSWLARLHSANGVFQIRGDEPKRRTRPDLQKVA
jgi:hypothetical protein